MRAHWFLPETPDVLATLGRQVEITVTGLVALAAWAHGDASQQAVLRDAEHAADAVRRELSGQLRAAFSTPIDQEDLYTLSERLDVVLNTAKNVVREAEALELDPDPPLTLMADLALEGVRHLGKAIGAVASDADVATSEADRATAAERKMEKQYRLAMRDVMRTDLVRVDDLHVAFGRRELYRRMLELGERVAAVADRVWYAVVKEA